MEVVGGDISVFVLGEGLVFCGGVRGLCCRRLILRYLRWVVVRVEERE